MLFSVIKIESYVSGKKVKTSVVMISTNLDVRLCKEINPQ